MSIDLLPFSAFALESCAAPAPAPGDGQTLTLPLRIGRASATPALAAQLLLDASEEALPGEHVDVLAPPRDGPLTITF
jgi:hypothetical protein